MTIQKVFLAFVFNVLKTAADSKSGCSISIDDDLGNPQPLLIYSKNQTGEKSFYRPTSRGIIYLKNGDSIQVACPGSNLVVKGKSGEQVDRVICRQRKFYFNEEAVHFREVKCKKFPKYIAKNTNNNCFGNNKTVEIGFSVGNDFLKVMNICFDKGKETTLYSQFVLTNNIKGYQVSFPRPRWIGEIFSIPDVDKLYSRKVQRRTINNLLGLSPRSVKYIKENDGYLARGHLTSKADFVYGAQQSATFFLINAIPQWQPFNAGNWENLEQSVRDFSARIRKDLTVYTGTYGVTTLPHKKTNKQTKLYLYVNGRTKKVPVPQLIWKVLYEPKSKAGIAFVGVNNPYKESSFKDIICKDVCEKVNWIKFDRHNQRRGHIYCCAVEDFRKSVNTLPNFIVEKMLL